MSRAASLQGGYALGVLVDGKLVLDGYNTLCSTDSTQELRNLLCQHGTAQLRSSIGNLDIDCAGMRHHAPESRTHPLREHAVFDSAAVIGRTSNRQRSLYAMTQIASAYIDRGT
jgi:hypothetical protein